MAGGAEEAEDPPAQRPDRSVRPRRPVLGFLFGILFFVPVIGAGVGAAAGAIFGKLEDVGVDDDFINNVKEKVTEGTSALFLLSSGAVADRIRQRFAGTHLSLIESNLSAEDEAALRDRLGSTDRSRASTGRDRTCWVGDPDRVGWAVTPEPGGVSSAAVDAAELGHQLRHPPRPLSGSASRAARRPGLR